MNETCAQCDAPKDHARHQWSMNGIGYHPFVSRETITEPGEPMALEDLISVTTVEGRSEYDDQWCGTPAVSFDADSGILTLRFDQDREISDEESDMPQNSTRGDAAASFVEIGKVLDALVKMTLPGGDPGASRESWSLILAEVLDAGRWDEYPGRGI